MDAARGTWTITVRDPAGGEVRITVEGGTVRVDPPDAVRSPFVAAAVREVTRSATRPRERPACARDPSSVARPGPRGRASGESHTFG